jgi:signal transduction histidine kinase/CheY-like chemotaxis protein
MDSIDSHQNQSLESELIRQVYQNAPIGIFASVVNATILVAILWNQTSPTLLLGWYICILIISISRFWLYIAFRRQKHPAVIHSKWKLWHTLSLSLSGITWGASGVIIFPAHSVAHQAFIALVLCGMVAGAVGAFSSILHAFTVFSLPALSPLLIRLLSIGDPIHYAMAFMTLIFFGLTFLTARNLNKTQFELIHIKENFAEKVRLRTSELKQINKTLQNEIQEKLQSEEALRFERDKLETITRNLGAGLAIISKDYRTVWANQVLKQHFGDVEGHKCYRTYIQKERMCSKCGVREIFEHHKKKVVHQQKSIDAHGNEIWFEIIATPIMDAAGNITSALELVIPINKRKEREKEKLELQTRLQEAQKADAIAALAGGMAHQFNNALASIIGNISLIDIKTKHDAAIQRYLNHIRDASQRMSELTRQLLAYARGGKYQAKIININKLIEETLTLTKHTIPSSIKIETDLANGTCNIRVDVTQLQMVIAAILANASEAIYKEGLIHIKTTNVDPTEAHSLQAKYGIDSPCVCLAISDNGKGMTSETLQRIFDPFFTTKSHGRGLGMAAAYGIVSNHGGLITIDSSKGHGSSVQVYLPVAQPPEDINTQNQKIPSRLKQTILLVDDEEMVLNVNQLMLNKLGYEVLGAGNGQEALRVAQEYGDEIDLAILDVMLPDMDGRQLLSDLKKRHPCLKVLVCSGLSGERMVDELLDAGAGGFIQKPFSMQTLGKTISEIMAKP